MKRSECAREMSDGRGEMRTPPELHCIIEARAWRFSNKNQKASKQQYNKSVRRRRVGVVQQAAPHAFTACRIGHAAVPHTHGDTHGDTARRHRGAHAYACRVPPLAPEQEGRRRRRRRWGRRRPRRSGSMDVEGAGYWVGSVRATCT